MIHNNKTENIYYHYGWCFCTRVVFASLVADRAVIALFRCNLLHDTAIRRSVAQIRVYGLIYVELAS